MPRILLGIFLSFLPVVSIINNVAFAQDLAGYASNAEKIKTQQFEILFLSIVISILILVGIWFLYSRKRKRQTTVK